MNFFIFVFCSTIYLIKIASSGTVHHCFESPRNPGLRVGMFLADDLSFDLKKIFLKYRMKGVRWRDDEAKIYEMDLQHIEESCESAGITLPNVNKAHERVTTHITMFSDNTERFIIEYFEVYQYGYFERKFLRIEGLKGIAQLNVLFSPEIKELKLVRDPAFKYSDDLGKLSQGQKLCLKLLKTGDPILLEISTSIFYTRNIFSPYLFEISTLNSGVEDNQKTYLAEGYVCTEKESYSKLNIYIDELLDGKTWSSSVRISLHDSSGLAPLNVSIEPKDGKYQDELKNGDFDVFPMRVLQEKPDEAVIFRNAVLMFRVKEEIKHCELHFRAYVKLHKAGSLIVERISHLINPEQSSRKIKVMYRGTQDQIDKCLNQK